MDHLARSCRTLPRYVRRGLWGYLNCGRLEYGFSRVHCSDCRTEKLLTFGCKRRGFCPSWRARRMVESAREHRDHGGMSVMRMA